MYLKGNYLQQFKIFNAIMIYMDICITKLSNRTLSITVKYILLMLKNIFYEFWQYMRS